MEESRSGEQNLDAQTGDDSEGASAAGLHFGDVLVGKYRVERTLGRGSMGIVLSATHLALGELVAIKVLSPRAAHRRGIARLEREARATARIRSEHVARVMDVGMLEEGKPFIVMEYLEGRDVAAALKDKSPLPIVEAVDMIVQACDALAAAHVMGIVHRDLKPSNLFLADQLDGSTKLKVLDFGLSKIPEAGADGRLTSATAVMGSPHYMAPEQIANPHEVDARADIWSLGVILYELVTGRLPFEASSQAELFARISTAEPARPAALRDDLPPPIHSLIAACLQKNKTLRPTDVGVIARLLSPFCSPAASVLPERVRRVIEARSAGGAPNDVPEAPTREGLTLDEPAETFSMTGGSDDGSAGQTFSHDAADRQLARVGMRLGGRFHIERFIGRGAMGAVYEVSDADGERFAAKLIPIESAADPEARARLRREARLSSSLSSPHVVTVFDIYVEDGDQMPFIVMELLQGRNLAETLTAEGAMPPRVVARLFRQVCAGLAAAHERGLVHRDVKPANIFLHEGAAAGVTVKVCDFGIAKRIESSALDANAHALTKTGFMLGTPAYASPEQIKDATTVDSRSDIWSLCVAMYESLAGKTPWPHGKTPWERMFAICTEAPVPLSSAAPWVDPQLAAIVQRGLERDPERRWQSASELDGALAQYAGEGSTLDRRDLSGVPPEQRHEQARVFGKTASDTDRGPPRRVPLRAIALLAVMSTGLVIFMNTPEKPATARGLSPFQIPSAALFAPEPKEVPSVAPPPESGAPLASGRPSPPAPRVDTRKSSEKIAPVSPPSGVEKGSQPSAAPAPPPAPSSSVWKSPTGMEMQSTF